MSVPGALCFFGCGSWALAAAGGSQLGRSLSSSRAGRVRSACLAGLGGAGAVPPSTPRHRPSQAAKQASHRAGGWSIHTGLHRHHFLTFRTQGGSLAGGNVEWGEGRGSGRGRASMSAASGPRGQLTCCLKQPVHLASRLADLLGRSCPMWLVSRREWRVTRHCMPSREDQLAKASSRPLPNDLWGHAFWFCLFTQCPLPSYWLVHGPAPGLLSFLTPTRETRILHISGLPPNPAVLGIPALPLCVHTFDILS